MDLEYDRSTDYKKIEAHAEELFSKGKYMECIQFVDNLCGWGNGQLARAFTKCEAEVCMMLLPSLNIHHEEVSNRD